MDGRLPFLPSLDNSETLGANISQGQLRGALKWLFELDSESDGEYSKASLIRSSWLTSMSIVVGIRAFVEASALPSEFKLALKQALIRNGNWLINRDLGDGGNWDEHLYDTAIVLRAIFMLAEHFPEFTFNGQEEKLRTAAGWILRCLKGEQTGNEPSDAKNSGSVARAIHTLLMLTNSTTSRIKTLGNPLPKGEISKIIRSRTQELVDQLAGARRTSGDSISASKDLGEYVDTIFVLGQIYQIETSKKRGILGRIFGKIDSRFSEIASTLELGVSDIEHRLYQKPATHIDRSRMLASYIRTHSAIAGNSNAVRKSLNDGIIVFYLHNLTEDSVFENGSIYNDIYATVAYADLLLSVISCWDNSSKNSSVFYELAVSIVINAGASERKDGKIFELIRENREQKEKLEKRKTILLRLSLAAILLVCLVVGHLFYLQMDLCKTFLGVELSTIFQITMMLNVTLLIILMLLNPKKLIE